MVDTIRMKRPAFPPSDDETSGRVKRDDRGNAIWEWKDEETINQRLYHPGLEIAPEEPMGPAGPVARPNREGAKSGYDPYGSGMIDKDAKPKPRKRDLRALSEWIALKKARGEDPRE